MDGNGSGNGNIKSEISPYSNKIVVIIVVVIK
jgi:hypothetical protein